MSENSEYVEISNKEFIKMLEKSVKDANNYCEKLQQEKDNLIKHLEDKIKELKMYMTGLDYYKEEHDDYIKLELYQDILERVKSGKYD